MTQSTPLLTCIEAVVFDVYGTIVEIQDKRSPYKKLLQLLAQKGRPHQKDDGARLMSMPAGLAEIAQLLGYALSEQELAPIVEDLSLEIASLRLYPDTTPTLLALQEAGLKLAVCSNLAAPYAAPVVKLLPITLDAYIWSFEAGAIKPEPAIYSAVIAALNLPAEKILFVGDTLLADYTGPQNAGMRSVHLNRKNKALPHFTIQSLVELM